MYTYRENYCPRNPSKILKVKISLSVSFFLFFINLLNICNTKLQSRQKKLLKENSSQKTSQAQTIEKKKESHHCPQCARCPPRYPTPKPGAQAKMDATTLQAPSPPPLKCDATDAIPQDNEKPGAPTQPARNPSGHQNPAKDSHPTPKSCCHRN